jgi:hypothetical protein
MKFRNQADDIRSTTSNLDPTSPTFNQRKIEHEAAVANIVNPILRPAQTSASR